MNTSDRYCLTLDESTGYWWINDEMTGQCFETDTQNHAEARQILAEHILYSND